MVVLTSVYLRKIVAAEWSSMLLEILESGYLRLLLALKGNLMFWTRDSKPQLQTFSYQETYILSSFLNWCN